MLSLYKCFKRKSLTELKAYYDKYIDKSISFSIWLLLIQQKGFR